MIASAAGMTSANTTDEPETLTEWKFLHIICNACYGSLNVGSDPNSHLYIDLCINTRVTQSAVTQLVKTK